MLGSGTQADPFVPTTWEEFITAVGTPGAYVAFPEGGGTIDMSSHGFFEDGTSTATMFPIVCAEIKGNGWKIRGLSWKTIHFFGNSTSSNDTTIDNLHFTDFYVLSAGEFISASENNLTFTGCTFSGIVDASCFCYAKGVHLTFERCSFTLELKNGASVDKDTVRGGEFYNCNIKLTGSMSGGSIIEAYDFAFCYLSGDMIFDYTGSTGYLLQISNSSAKQYSIIDINITYQKGSALTIKNYGSTLVNTDKIKDMPTLTLQDSTFAVTESQLHDAEYLNSIGFAIGVD